MNIKKEVKKINDHFVQQIMDENFELVKHSQWVTGTIMLNIIVDGFKFCLWDCANVGEVCNGTGDCFMELQLTVKQSKKLNTIIKRIYKEKYQKIEEAAEKREYERLRTKFETGG